MSAKLLVQGIEITVPTAELGEAMRQLAPFFENQGAPFLGIGSIASGLALVGRKRAAAPVTSARSADSAPPPPDVAFAVTEAEVELTLRFLKRIADHAMSGGLTTEEVKDVLGASHVKGVGSKTASVNKVLGDLGFPVTDVYRNDPSAASGGERVWTAGPRIKDAIDALEPL